MGSLPGAVTQPVVSTPGGNRGQGVRGEMGMNSGKGHRSSEIRIILSEARLAGQRGHVQQHSEGPFSLLFSLAVRTLKFQSFNNWNYVTKSSDKVFLIGFYQGAHRAFDIELRPLLHKSPTDQKKHFLT